ncbi:MAG: hypothetical protein K8R21_14220 [Leptospira sp.]|nr:hypothetical protein [Leptospira sp.]
MYYENMDMELKSSFYKLQDYSANLVGETQLPSSGLKASKLLDQKQMAKLKSIRSRHLSGQVQKEKFLQD